MKQTVRAALLAFREAFGAPDLERTPEPSSAMSDREGVMAFHQAGDRAGVLTGVYEFNARCVSALAPRGTTVLDLGCGSGQCAAHLAARRPDLRLIGIDLSPPMVEVGNEMLARRGLSDRVELRVGDMTTFSRAILERIGVITSIFSLHHLPGRAELDACLGEIEKLRARDGASLWIFDHARPRKRATAERFPAVFTPSADAAFNLDSRNSLIASWSFSELRDACQSASGATVRSELAKLLPLYQIHWVPLAEPARVEHDLWRETDALTDQARREAKSLRGLFAALPL